MFKEYYHRLRFINESMEEAFYNEDNIKQALNPHDCFILESMLFQLAGKYALDYLGTNISYAVQFASDSVSYSCIAGKYLNLMSTFETMQGETIARLYLYTNDTVGVETYILDEDGEETDKKQYIIEF